MQGIRDNQSQDAVSPAVPPGPPAPSPVMEPARFPLSEAGQLPLTPPPGDPSSGSENSEPPPFVPSPVPKRSLRPWQHGWAYDWSLPLRVPLWELELLEDVLEAG